MPNNPGEKKSGITGQDFKKLNAFIKALQTKLVVDVGIFGRKNTRHGGKGDSGAMTNSEIGFQHEFGMPSRHIPTRSFLRMPLFFKSEEILKRVKDAGAFKKLAAGKAEAVMTDVGIACEAIIEEAFESGGYGTWPKLSEATVHRKHSDAILIQTGQLRRSISSTVHKP